MPEFDVIDLEIKEPTLLVARNKHLLPLQFEAKGDETDERMEEMIAEAVWDYLEPTYELVLCEQIQRAKREGKNMVVYFGAESDFVDYHIDFEELSYVEKYRNVGEVVDFFYSND